MIKGEANHNAAGGDTHPAPHDSRFRAVSQASHPTSFIDPLAEKPERAGLVSIIPFLEERIALRMPSDVKLLDDVLDYLGERMLKLGIIEAGDTELMVALDEAIVNAIKHGNKCDPRKAVHIVAEFTAEGARFTVTDEGPGFARDSVPDPTSPCRLLEPNGRGLLLINHIMDEVCHNHTGNRIEMFKRVSHVEAQAATEKSR